MVSIITSTQTASDLEVSELGYYNLSSYNPGTLQNTRKLRENSQEDRGVTPVQI